MKRTLLMVTAALVVLFGSNAFSQKVDKIVKIEEFWELEVRDPDTYSVAPQLTSSMAPICSNFNKEQFGYHMAFCMNHQITGGSEFAAGGLQLQIWHGDVMVGQKTSDKRGVLGLPGEKITWRQEMSLRSDGVLTLSVRDGHSVTWNTFGNSLSASVATNLTDLNQYHPHDSIDNSGAVFAANRVTEYELTKVQVTYNSGEVKIIDFTCGHDH